MERRAFALFALGLAALSVGLARGTADSALRASAVRPVAVRAVPLPEVAPEPTPALHRSVASAGPRVGLGTSTPRSLGSTLRVELGGGVRGEVELVLRDGSLEWARGSTVGGVWRVEGLAPGSYLLGAELPPGLVLDLAPHEAWNAREGSPTWREVTVPGAGAPVRVVLPVVRVASVAGLLLDAEGAACAGAELLLQDACRPSLVRRAITEPGGLFRFDRLAPSRYLLASADPTRPGAILPRAQELRAGEGAWLELRPHGGERRLTGRVADAEGQPVPDLRLRCVLSAPEEGGGRTPAALILARTRTNGAGAFLFEGLPQGSLRVEVEPRAAARLAEPFEPQLVTEVEHVDLGSLGVRLAVAAEDPTRPEARR